MLFEHIEAVAESVDKVLIVEPLFDDRMEKAENQREVGPRSDSQPYVGAPSKSGGAGVHHDKLRFVLLDGLEDIPSPMRVRNERISAADEDAFRREVISACFLKDRTAHCHRLGKNRRGKTDMKVGAHDVRRPERAGQEPDQKERFPRPGALETAYRFCLILFSCLGEPGRDLIEGVVPRNPLPFSLPFSGRPFQGILQTIGMVGEIGVLRSFHADITPAHRMALVGSYTSYLAITDVNQDAALRMAPLAYRSDDPFQIFLHKGPLSPSVCDSSRDGLFLEKNPRFRLLRPGPNIQERAPCP